MPAVRIRLVNLEDTTKVDEVTAGEDGSFETRVDRGAYRIEAKRLGYEPLRITVRVTSTRQDVGILILTPSPIGIPGTEVMRSPPVAILEGDTTEYQAGAVKTSKDASVEELVQKLPGISVENGQLKAHGEAVQQVLVNGRPYFGDDPMVALRNVPADVIDRIQVYDRQSTQAELSGFDDGQRKKTMNLVLRDQKARFGRLSGGLGDHQRYNAAGSASVVQGNSRLTAIALSNDVNERNFSPQDLLGVLSGSAGSPRTLIPAPGGGTRAPGSGPPNRAAGAAVNPASYLIGQQAGISTTHSGGANYVTSMGARGTISSSLFVNGTGNENDQTVRRRYLPPQNGLAFYDQRTVSESHDDNQRIDARIEWAPDSVNAVTFEPRLYFQRNRDGDRGLGTNLSEDRTTLSRAESDGHTTTQGDNLSARLTALHRFAKRGRNLSAELLAGHTRRDGDGADFSVTDYDVAGVTARDTLDQHSNTDVMTRSLSTRIAFTESVTQHVQVQGFYNPSLDIGESNSRGWRSDPTGAYTIADSAASNVFASRTATQSGGLAARLSLGSWKLLGIASLQHTRLRSTQSFPQPMNVDRSFEGVLPTLTMTGTLPDRSSLRVALMTTVTVPSIGQLQNVLDNSNALSMSMGNPGLRPAYNTSLSLRLMKVDPSRSRNRLLSANLSRTSHTIGNSIVTAASDTTIDGVFLARGTRLTRPANLGESWTANVLALTSRPAQWLRSVVSADGGGTYTRTPTRSNGLDDATSACAIRGGLTIASNISPNVDFTVSYRGNYNLSRSSGNATGSGDYYTHTLGLRLSAVVGSGVVLRQELSQDLQGGMSSANDRNTVLWNTSIGKKLLRSERGEIRVTAKDVLGQNKSLSRTSTETYIQDSRDRTLTPYVMTAFSYSFR